MKTSVVINTSDVVNLGSLSINGAVTRESLKINFGW